LYLMLKSVSVPRDFLKLGRTRDVSYSFPQQMHVIFTLKSGSTSIIRTMILPVDRMICLAVGTPAGAAFPM
jgi:hypothetical protein